MSLKLRTLPVLITQHLHSKGALVSKWLKWREETKEPCGFASWTFPPSVLPCSPRAPLHHFLVLPQQGETSSRVFLFQMSSVTRRLSADSRFHGSAWFRCSQALHHYAGTLKCSWELGKMGAFFTYGWFVRGEAVELVFSHCSIKGRPVWEGVTACRCVEAFLTRADIKGGLVGHCCRVGLASQWDSPTVSFQTIAVNGKFASWESEKLL